MSSTGTARNNSTRTAVAWIVANLKTIPPVPFGGVFVNLALRQSFLSNGTAYAAYIGFIGFYLACVLVTWAVYLRPSPRRLAGV